MLPRQCWQYKMSLDIMSSLGEKANLLSRTHGPYAVCCEDVLMELVMVAAEVQRRECPAQVSRGEDAGGHYLTSAKVAR